MISFFWMSAAMTVIALGLSVLAGAVDKSVKGGNPLAKFIAVSFVPVMYLAGYACSGSFILVLILCVVKLIMGGAFSWTM